MVRASALALIGILLAGGGLAEKGCRALGRTASGADRISVAELVGGARREREVRVQGTLNVGFESNVLCPEGVQSARGSWRECLPVFFDWEALAPGRAEALRVLRQWKGGTVLVDARVRWHLPSPEPPALIDIVWVEYVGGDSSEAYCLGHKGPALASAWEQGLPAAEPGRRRCLGWTEIGPRTACVDPVHPIVWRPVVVNSKVIAIGGETVRIRRIEYESTAFSPPEPYSTRDVVEFRGLSDSVFVFTLPTGQLYAWDGAESRLLDSARVDRLEDSGGGVVFYRARRTADGELRWNGLRRVHSDLGVETVWESDRVELEGGGGAADGSPLSVTIRLGGERAHQRYDPVLGAWGKPRRIPCLPHDPECREQP